ncbi:hypothetical protein ACQPZJ_18665 [Actinoplanes sp. CA-054009]
MRSARIARAAAAIATIGAAVVGFYPQSASAAYANGPYYWNGIGGQFDNNPGNGAQSWAWVNNTNSWGSGYIRIKFYDNSTTVLGAANFKSNTGNYNQDIWQIQMCVYQTCSKYYP